MPSHLEVEQHAASCLQQRACCAVHLRRTSAAHRDLVRGLEDAGTIVLGGWGVHCVATLGESTNCCSRRCFPFGQRVQQPALLRRGLAPARTSA